MSGVVRVSVFVFGAISENTSEREKVVREFRLEIY